MEKNMERIFTHPGEMLREEFMKPMGISANALAIPDNSVAAGNPCKVICTLDEYRKKHKDDFLYMVSMPRDKKKDYLLKKLK